MYRRGRGGGRLPEHVVGARHRCADAAHDAAASGRADLYWERNLNSWDIAAGIILVREAGGFATGADGKSDPMAAGSVACGNEQLHRQLVAILAKA